MDQLIRQKLSQNTKQNVQQKLAETRCFLLLAKFNRSQLQRGKGQKIKLILREQDARSPERLFGVL
jgi:hypothetical protein